MAEIFIKNKGELLRIKRKKKRISKFVLVFILLISLSITLCLKLSYFNISEIKVYNNKNLSVQEIIKLSNINKGSNIFYINTKESATDILKNSYILHVDIKRNLPSSIDITVEERSASFYAVKGDTFLIVGKDGTILEEKQSLDNSALIKLLGFNTKDAIVGKKLPQDDERKISVIGTVTDFINRDKSKFKIISVDISDLLNIRIYYANMYVKLGTSEDLSKKLDKAITMLELDQLKNAKGYIDVSVISKPVFYIEK